MFACWNYAQNSRHWTHVCQKESHRTIAVSFTRVHTRLKSVNMSVDALEKRGTFNWLRTNCVQRQTTKYAMKYVTSLSNDHIDQLLEWFLITICVHYHFLFHFVRLRQPPPGVIFFLFFLTIGCCLMKKP